MNSISIVYKQSRRHSQPHPHFHLQPTIPPPNCHHQTALRSETPRGKIRMRRVKSSKQDYNNIGGTLTVAPMTIQKTASQLPLPLPKQPISISRKKKSIDSKPTLKFLRQWGREDIAEENNQQEKGEHCKLKLCFREALRQQPMPTIMALSTNLIVDEEYFWGDSQVDEASVGAWRQLQNYACIVWFCRKQVTSRKVVKFAKRNGLRLDAIYQVVPRKNKRLLTVSFWPIQNEFGVRSGAPLNSIMTKRMIVVSGLNVESVNREHISAQSLVSAIPVLSNYNAVVHLIKAGSGERGRLGAVVRILSKKNPPLPFNINAILTLDWNSRHQLENRRRGQMQSEEEEEEELNVLHEIEKIKSRLMRWFNTTMSRKMSDRVVHEDKQHSTQFIIGDALRRNYRIFKDYYQFLEEWRQGAQPVYHNSPRQTTKSINYRNNVFLWDT